VTCAKFCSRFMFAFHEKNLKIFSEYTRLCESGSVFVLEAFQLVEGCGRGYVC